MNEKLREALGLLYKNAQEQIQVASVSKNYALAYKAIENARDFLTAAVLVVKQLEDK